MRSYFQRLIARAEGRNFMPALTPSSRRAPDSTGNQDPFETVVESPPSFSGQPARVETRSDSKASGVAVDSTLSNQAQENKKLRQVSRPASETSSTEEVGDRNIASPNPSPTRRLKTEVAEEIEAFSVRKIERKISERKINDEPETLEPESQTRGGINRPDSLPVVAPDQLSRTGKEDETEDNNDRFTELARAVVEQLTPHLKAVEPSAQTAKTASDERLIDARQQLMPPPVAISPDSTRDEPRLVIGRLRVEVLPAPPEAPRSDQRAARHVSAPSRKEGVETLSSNLRFGLGQM
ncbi:MAG: hypothetical protein WBV94_23805 [Blastocatellia bacterium]